MQIDVCVAKAFGAFRLEIAFTVRTGELKVVTGPSGAGKTTLLRLLAGLEKPDQGTIRCGGETWVDTAAGVFLPPRRRRIGYVFQEYTLFPHLDVYRNVAFAAADRAAVEALMKRFGIWHLRDRRPHSISGGERQRCAICQNLARNPRLLLLDEPLSALDVETRCRLRAEIKDLNKRRQLSMVYVTHDLAEALFLGADILAVVDGKSDPAWFGGQLKRMLDDRAMAQDAVAPARIRPVSPPIREMPS